MYSQVLHGTCSDWNYSLFIWNSNVSKCPVFHLVTCCIHECSNLELPKAFKDYRRGFCKWGPKYLYIIIMIVLKISSTRWTTLCKRRVVCFIWCSCDLVAIAQSHSCVRLFVTPWTVAHQASLSFTISQSLLKLTSVELMMPSNHLVLCHPLLLPSIFPSIRVFSSELTLCIRWPKYQSFSFSISPSSKHSGLFSFRID